MPQEEPTTIELDRPPEWVTSDTHLGHARILEFCPERKAWGTVHNIEQHDDLVVGLTRKYVSLGHTILHLGDFAFGSAADVKTYALRMPFTLALVCGNHDRSMTNLREACGIERVGRRARFWAPGLGRVVCRHRPKDFTEEDVANADVLLHGHCHGNSAHHDGDTIVAGAREKMFDMGVDVFGPGPVPLYLLPNLLRMQRAIRGY